jgi:CBS domain-containing protein
VLGDDGRLAGIVLSDVLRTIAANPDLREIAIAHDLMIPPVSVQESDDLQRALEVILEHGLREILVVDSENRIVGFLDETEITTVYQRATVVQNPRD